MNSTPSENWSGAARPGVRAELPRPDKMAIALGWPDLLERLAALCHTARGTERARALPLLTSAEAIDAELSLVAEARALHDRGEPPPFGEIWDLRPALRRLEKEGSLEGPTLVQLAQTLQAGARLGRFLRDRKGEAQALGALAAHLAALDDVSGPIREAFTETGMLADDASEELGQLRRKLHELHERLVKRMRGLMEAPHIAKHLQDTFYTQREDRYVLPVRSDAGPVMEGIVHGSSGSGATLFIEPKEVVGLNNELKVAEIDVVREEARILAALSALVGEERPAIEANLELLEQLDVIDARARLALALGAHRPRIASGGRIRLEQMRHPLMVLAGAHVVENDLELEPGRALIISGPNAGGKTVCLKTLGLCALMLRAGMHLPAGPDSELPCYATVLAEMGDEQSIEQSLSTFTAHLTHLLDFIERAGPTTLVLLDEIAIGTDPGEGAALAHALLEALAETGAQIVVTTHYERLKSLPIADARFVNASVGFELERMAPTYRLHLGVPGSSGALAVARRIGLPERIAARAAALLDRGAQELGALLTALAGEQTRLEEQRGALVRAEAEARALAEEQRQAVQRLRDTQREALAGEFSRALEELRGARQELERVRQLLRRPPTKERVAQADRQISAAAETIRAREPRDPAEGLPARLEDIVLGARLLVPQLGGIGEVLEPPVRGKVLVRIGGIRTAVLVEDLRLPPPGAPAEERRKERAASDAATSSPAPPATDAHRPPLRTDEITLNVRGLRVDEAVAEVDRFLDRALRSGDAVLFIIHGHGTGALKSALRAHLSASELVDRIQPAEARDGGDGVTVVWLR